MIINNYDIDNYEEDLIKDLSYNIDDTNEIINTINLRLDCPSIDYKIEETYVKNYALDLNKCIIKRIYLKLDLTAYDKLLLDDNLINDLLGNIDFKLIINNNTLFSNMLNVLILDKYDNKYDDKIIINVFNFYKYKCIISFLSKGLYIDNNDKLYLSILSSNMYNETSINLLIDNLYIEYVSFNNIDKSFISKYSSKNSIDSIKIVCNYLDNDDTLFKFYIFRMAAAVLYISLYIEDNDDIIEDIILNDEFSVSFHKIYILNKLIYIIPLTYDLLEKLDNINYYVSNKIIINEDNYIYKLNHHFFKVITNKINLDML